MVDWSQRLAKEHRLQSLGSHFMALGECLDQVTADLMEHEILERAT